MDKYTYESRIRYSEVNESQDLTLYSLLNYLQDCATFHSEDVGLTLNRNIRNGHAWIVADMQLKILRQAKFNDRILVKTWPGRFRGVIGHRFFSIEKADGEMIALVKSDWVFMDMIHGVPINVPQEQKDGYGEFPELAIEMDLGKRKIRVPEGGEVQKAFEIREEHLDTNQHMNNAQYVRLAAKYLPVDFSISGMRAEWKKQAYLGDLLTPSVQLLDKLGYVQFLDAAGELVFSVEFQK